MNVFPPLPATEGVIRVNFAEFARVPDFGPRAPRLMTLVAEPATRRLFVSDMNGILYAMSEDGRTVTPYLDLTAAQWNVSVQAQGNERGFQSFAFHPEFNRAGTRGFGRFYTYVDSSNMTPTPDFIVDGGMNTHHTVLLEWVAKNPAAAAYDGGPPRELMRFRQPYANHNAGHLAFHPQATPGSPEYGLLYMGVADGGSGGDPLKVGQRLDSAFGKVFRVDPLGTNSRNGKYGIPASNPFVGGNRPALGEIYASGVRNPQRFGWDSRNGNLFLADIGQNLIEEVSIVTPGANLGWSEWEGSYRFISRTEIALDQRRSDPSVTYPVVEFDHSDPLLQGTRAAVTGAIVYRQSAVPQLANHVIFGDIVGGEVFVFNADRLPAGGSDGIRRVLFNSGGEAKTVMTLVREAAAAQGRPMPPTRADLRFGEGRNGELFLLNKGDGIVRVLRP